jgi:hypothetical protein
MEYDDSTLDANNLTIKELKSRLVLLGEELDFENRNKQFYVDLYEKCISRDPANYEMIKNYQSNKKDKMDSALSKKRPRDEDNLELDNIAKKEEFCNNMRLTSSEKKYLARTLNNLPNLNYPTTDIGIHAVDDVSLEVEENAKFNRSAQRSDFNRSNSDSLVSPNINERLENINTSSNYCRINSFTPNRSNRKFEKPRSVSPIKRSENRSPIKICSCGGVIKENKHLVNKPKTVNTLNVKNLLGAAGLMCLGAVGYCCYQNQQQIIEKLQPFINPITNFITANQHNLLIGLAAVVGMIAFVLIMKKIKEAADKKLESLARKIIAEAEKKIFSLRSEGLANSVESEAFVEDYCKQNKVWLMKRCIVDEITRILKHNDEKLQEKVSVKTWVLK